MADSGLQNNARPRLIKRIGLTLLVILAVLMSLSLIVQIPMVQKWGVRYITRSLSEQTGSAVSVASFSLNVFSQFTLQNVYISQHGMPADTLVYAGELGVKFSRLWKLFGSKPEISRLRLHEARLFIRDVPVTLFASSQEKGGGGIRIMRPEIHVDDVRVLVDKGNAPMVHEYVLDRGVVKFSEINTADGFLAITFLRLNNPVAILSERSRSVPSDSIGVKGDTVTSRTKPAQSWSIILDNLLVSGGRLEYHGHGARDSLDNGGIDYQNLHISDLSGALRDICYEGSTVSGEIRGIGFKEESGFQLERFAAKHFFMAPDLMTFGGLEILTPNSIFTDTIAISFGEQGDAAPAVETMELYARSRDSRVALEDLLTAIPGIRGSVWVKQNRNELLSISGIVRGNINRLRGDSLRLQLGQMSFKGQFRSRNLAVPGRQVLNLIVDQARFKASDLARHIPGVRIQNQFNKLGTIQFQGRFDGFMNDFVAYGKVSTDLGRAELDMNLETSTKETRYSGSVSLNNFNLQKWTGRPEFGSLSATLQLRDGSGLTAETAMATIAGTIREFGYKGYVYTDAVVDGRLNQNQFDGRLEIHDPNIDMVFAGSVRQEEDFPVFDFAAHIDALDLRRLHLSRDTVAITGVISAKGRGKDFASLRGGIQATGVRVLRGDHEAYNLDTLFLDIETLDNGDRLIRSTSDYVDGWIKGDFEIQALYPSIARFLQETYPQFFTNLKYNRALVPAENRMSFEVVLNKPEEWGGIFHLRDTRFHDLRAVGVLDLAGDSVYIDITAPDVHYGKINVYELRAHVESLGGQASAKTHITAIDINENYFFDEISASIRTREDGFEWSLAADDLLEELNTLDLTGTFLQDTMQKVYTLHLDPEVIEILDEKWELRAGNRMRFGKDFIELRDIVLEKGDQVITVADVGRRGVLFETRNFDFRIIDVIWDYDKLDFDGAYTLRAGVSDVFRMEGFYLTVDAQNLLVNGDSFGVLNVDTRMERKGSPVVLQADLNHTGIHVHAGGRYFPPILEVSPQLRNTLDIGIALDTFPMAFLEYFLQDAIHNTVGYGVGNVRIFGTMDKTKMDGDVVIYGCATTVSYLGARYLIDGQPVHISESFIDATGGILKDEYGNTAQVEGGLTHRVLAKIGFNARITSPRILALNTTRADNSTYYGKGIGAIDARFQGPADRPTISVDGVTSEGTYIVINLADVDAGRDRSFIRFRNDETVLGSALRTRTTITGMNFDMNLTATPDATVEIKLEENPPESIIGSGNGNIQMSINRSGDFSVYGEYEIERGDYLFRSFVIINKPFVLRQGGTIRWSGDPYNADINIEADYAGLRASLSTLLAEYLVNASAEAIDEAKRKTDVELKLLLTGTLLEPEINFDLQFPNLSGELSGYADTKLRVLKSNQNALNEQVFGLLWAGAFLPSNVLQTNASLQLAEEGISNSVTEFLSAQVSAMFSSVISRWVQDVGFISGIDFDVGYSRESLFDAPAAGESSQRYQEWEVRVKNRLFNDRVIIDAGGNYVTDSPVGGGAYFVGDYALEYLLTRDGRLKVRFYYRNEETIEGRKNKVGIGLAWRREFDSFEEWIGGLQKEAKKMKDGEKL